MRLSRHKATVLLLLAGVTTYLLFCSFNCDGTPILLGGDQAYFWTYAMRLRAGERVYRDFFQFTPPGTDLVYFAAFSLFGPRVWVANAVVVVVGLALSAVCLRVASEFLDDSLAALSVALFIVLVYGRALDATHHWFSLLAIMGAVAALPSHYHGPRSLGAGALLGFASFFTLSHGAVALCAFALFAALQTWRKTLSPRRLVAAYCLLLCGYALTLLLASLYFVVTTGVTRLWWFQIAFPTRYMVRYAPWSRLGLATLGLNPPPTWRHVVSFARYVLVYILLLGVYCSIGMRLYRTRGSVQPGRDRVTLVWLVGVSLLIEVVTTPNWIRIFAVAMPGLVLSPAVFDSTGRMRTLLLRLAWMLAACIALNHVRGMHKNYATAIVLPAGRTTTDPPHEEQLAWLAGHTSPGEYFFASTWPSYYFLLGLRSPVFLDVLEPTEQTRPEFAVRAIAELDARCVKYALWAPRWYDVPAGDRGIAGALAIGAYVHSRYRLVHTFSDGEQVWRRRSANELP